MTAPLEIMAKGLNFHGFVRAVRDLKGAGVAEQVVEATAIAEARESLREGRVTAAGWYPVAWYRALHDAAQTVIGSEAELARRIGHESMRGDLVGVYRLVASMLAPETVVRIGYRLWTSYWNGGVVETMQHQKGLVQTSFTGCHGFDHNVWNDVLGSCQALLEAAGARDVETRALEGGVDGAHQMLLDARWQA